MNALRDRYWYPTLTTAGLSRRTMYQTRHTFASNALAAGEAPSWVAAMLGTMWSYVLDVPAVFGLLATGGFSVC